MPEADALVALGPLGLFVAAALAGSVFPFPSEAVLAGLLYLGQSALLLVLVASIGNTLGAWTLYLLARGARSGAQRAWAKSFRAIADDRPSLERALQRLERRGAPALLFAWLPGVGDALVVAAGIVGVRTAPFLLYTALGKSLRYVVVAWVLLGAGRA